MVSSLALPRLLAGLAGLSTSAAFSPIVQRALPFIATPPKYHRFHRSMSTQMAAKEHHKIALFDATGTLMLPAEPIGETYGRIARKHGLEVGSPDEIERRFRDVYGRTAAVDYTGLARAPHLVVEREIAWWRQIVAEVFAADISKSKVFEPCFEELFSLFGSSNAWTLYPESIPVLESLSQAGWTVGICSNFDHRLPAILQQLGVMDVASFVVLPGDCGCIKPQRDIFTTALQRAGVSDQHVGQVTCMHVGDSISADVVGALEAGIFPVLVDRRGKFADGPPPPPVPPSCLIVPNLSPVVESAASVPPMTRMPSGANKGPVLLVSPDDIS